MHNCVPKLLKAFQWLISCFGMDTSQFFVHNLAYQPIVTRSTRARGSQLAGTSWLLACCTFRGRDDW